METRKKRYENYRKKISMMSDEDSPDYVAPSSFKAEEVANKHKRIDDSMSSLDGNSPYLIYKKRRITSLLIRVSISGLIVIGLLVSFLILVL